MKTSSVLVANNVVRVTLKENDQVITMLNDLSEEEAKEIAAKWESGTYHLLTETSHDSSQ